MTDSDTERLSSVERLVGDATNPYNASLSVIVWDITQEEEPEFLDGTRLLMAIRQIVREELESRS